MDWFLYDNDPGHEGFKKRIHENTFLVTSMYGASLASTFKFRDAFWQKFSMYLLNFNWQSKFVSNSFSL